MRRRDCIGLLATIVIFRRRPARAQSRVRPFLIAVLIVGSKAASERYRSGFAAGLQELGYLQGRDYVLEERYADGVIGVWPSWLKNWCGFSPISFFRSRPQPTQAAGRDGLLDHLT
jgi:hypothetical protein